MFGQAALCNDAFVFQPAGSNTWVLLGCLNIGKSNRQGLSTTVVLRNVRCGIVSLHSCLGSLVWNVGRVSNLWGAPASERSSADPVGRSRLHFHTISCVARVTKRTPPAQLQQHRTGAQRRANMHSHCADSTWVHRLLGLMGVTPPSSASCPSALSDC